LGQKPTLNVYFYKYKNFNFLTNLRKKVGKWAKTPQTSTNTAFQLGHFSKKSGPRAKKWAKNRLFGYTFNHLLDIHLIKKVGQMKKVGQNRAKNIIYWIHI
jgi:hypothetical protein